MSQKIAVLSLHKSYDYRIYRHIKTLLKLGYELHYYNITNERNPDVGISHPNFAYKPFFVEKIISPRLLKVYFSVLTELDKDEYSYYFVQDEELLVFFLFKSKSTKNKLVIDVHEILDLDRKKQLLIDLVFQRLSHERSCITALQQNIGFLNRYFRKIYVFDNLPLRSDFLDVRDHSKNEKIHIIYSGMITEENRQMLKTIDVMELLVQTGTFKATLIGPIANRYGKESIERKIRELRLKYPDDFQYMGALPRHKVVPELLSSDLFLILVDLSYETTVSPNKLFEALAAGNIVVTNHSNFTINIPLELMLKVSRDSSAEEVAKQIMSFCKDREELHEKKLKVKEWFARSGLFWESFEHCYKDIFS